MEDRPQDLASIQGIKHIRDMDSIEDLLEYMWLRPNVTHLNIDVFVDDGQSYVRHGHELLLYARNGYGREVDEFVPFSVTHFIALMLAHWGYFF